MSNTENNSKSKLTAGDSAGSDLRESSLNQFISSRLNRDNLWNLFFSLGLASGFALAQLFDNDGSTLPFFISLATIITLLVLIAFYNKVTINEEGKFLNSNGTDITDRHPSLLALLFFTIGVPSFIAIILQASAMQHLILPDIISFLILFSGPSLYFIIINCPIAIMFKSAIWVRRGKSENF